MNEDSRKALYKNLRDTYGVENQLDKVTEELAELIQAVSKGKEQARKDGLVYGKVYMDIVQETADVSIMLEQLIEIYDIDMNDLEKVRDSKLRRTLDELNREIAKRR